MSAELRVAVLGAAGTIAPAIELEPLSEWGLGGGIVSTAGPVGAAVRLLARGRIVAAGAMPPERCIDPDNLFPDLEQSGCVFAVGKAVA